MDISKVLLLAVAAIFVAGGEATKVDFTNNCPYSVWPGTIGGAGVTQLPATGFILLPAQSTIIELAPTWSFGRFWGRTGCSYDATSNFTCLTGDCGTGKIECNGNPPALPTTIVEFVLSGPAQIDSFLIRLVDGFNLPPVEGNGTCKAKSCEKSVNRVCPPKLAVRNSKGHVVACKSACMAFQKAQYYCEGYYSLLKRCTPSSYAKLFKAQYPEAYSYRFDNRRTVACKSACLAFNRPEHCCNGTYDSPVTCPPTKYTKLFKDTCPQARSYVYDDSASTFTCPTGKDYLITFCP
ncbi:Thaumatin-like protein 1 [Linum perenne]